MKTLFSTLCVSAVSLFSATAAPSFNQTLAQSDEGDSIAVYLHGSNWNRLGEWAKTNIWDTPEFRQKLSGLKLVSIDHKEKLAFSKHSEIIKNLPAAKLQSLQSTNSQTRFKKQADGSYLASGSPANIESYTFSLTLDDAATVFVFDCLPDPSHADGRAGRSPNGNFWVSEVTATAAGKPVKFSAVWANRSEGKLPARFIIDGETGSKSSWSANSHKDSSKRRFILTTDKPLTGKVDFDLCFDGCNKHSIGRLLVRSTANKTLHLDIQNQFDIEAQRRENNRFKTSLKKYPAIVLVNGKGDSYAIIDDFSIHSTPDQVGQLVLAKQQLYTQQREWIEKANTTTGTRKIQMLGKILDTKGLLHNKEQRKELRKQLTSLGSADDHPYIRKHTFSLGGLKSKVRKLIKEKKQKEALQLIRKELKHPQNKLLEKSTLQGIYMLQFELCRSWKGHEAKRYAALEKIVALDPHTHIGIGAQGYLMKDGRGPASLTWGWRPKHIKQGKQTLDITIDVNKSFYRDGKFKLTVERHKGKDPVTLHHILLSTSDGAVIAQASPHAKLADGSTSLDIKLTEQQAKQKLKLSLKLHSPNGTDHYGRFRVTPEL